MNIQTVMHKGFTLIEMIVFLVVISTALLVTIKAMNHTLLQSLNPTVRFMAIEKAQSVLEEIYGYEFKEIASFHNFHDANDTNYIIDVTVIASGVDLDLANTEAWRITVTVDAPNVPPLSLAAYRVAF